MPPDIHDRPPGFRAYLLSRLRNRPCDIVGIAFVYLVMLAAGGWIPVAVTHVFLVRLASFVPIGRCLAFTAAVPHCGLAARVLGTAVTPGLPMASLFATALWCDYARFVRTWRPLASIQ